MTIESRINFLEKELTKVSGMLCEANCKIQALTDRVAKFESARRNESYYQTLLEKQFGSGHLPISGVGETDITTDDCHIEIKKWDDYDDVPGQLFKYNQAAPRRRLCVYLFGPRPSKKKVEHRLKFFADQGIEMYSFGNNDEITRHVVDTPDGAPDLPTLFKHTKLEWMTQDANRYWIEKTTLVAQFRLFLSEQKLKEHINPDVLLDRLVISFGDLRKTSMRRESYEKCVGYAPTGRANPVGIRGWSGWRWRVVPISVAESEIDETEQPDGIDTSVGNRL